MERYINRADTDAPACRQRDPGCFSMATRQECLQIFEDILLIREIVFTPKLRQGAFQQSQSPSFLINRVRRQPIRGLKLVMRFGLVIFQRNNLLTTAPLLGVHVFPLVCQKVFCARQKKRSKFTRGLRNPGDGLLFQEMEKECLGQIFCFVRSRTLATNEGINRLPINGAEIRQRLFAQSIVVSASRQNGSPVSGVKPSRSGVPIVRIWAARRHLSERKQ